MRLKRNLKRVGSLLCALALAAWLLPVTAQASNTSVKYSFVVRTIGDVRGAGGDSGAHAGLMLSTYDYSGEDMYTVAGVETWDDWKPYVDNGKDCLPIATGFDQGNGAWNYTHKYYSLTDQKEENGKNDLSSANSGMKFNTTFNVDPWMIKYFSFFYLDSDDICLNNVSLILPDGDKTTITNKFTDITAEGTRVTGLVGTEEGEGVWFSTDSSYPVAHGIDVGATTKRNITSLGNFGTGNSSVALTANSDSGKVALTGSTWNKTISDQYGTYDPTVRDDAPTYSVSTSNAAFNSLFTVAKEGEYAVKYSPAQVYQAMVNNNVTTLDVKTRLAFPNRSSDLKVSGVLLDAEGNYVEHTTTITAKYIKLNAPTISGGLNTGNRTYYSNASTGGKDVTITLPLAVGDAAKLACTAELYAGGTKVDAAVTRTNSGKNLVFKATVPDDTSYPDYLILKLTNMKYNNDGDYSIMYNSKTCTSLDLNFSAHYADTQTPAITITPKTDGTLLPAQSFYATVSSDEALYVSATGHGSNSNVAAFSIAPASAGSHAVDNRTPAMVNGIETNTNRVAHVGVTTTGVDMKIETQDSAEDVYNLAAEGYDDAGNYVCTFYKNIPLDTKAPLGAVETPIVTKAIDGVKTATLNVSITDLCNPEDYPGGNVYSRLYYYIDTKETAPTQEAGTLNSSTTSGAMADITDKWLFVDNVGVEISDETKTATTSIALTVGRGTILNGTLYWYTEDTAGNNSFSNLTNQTRAIYVNNVTPDDVLNEITNPEAALNEHKISFDLSRTVGEGESAKDYTYTVKYQWNGTEEERWKNYTAASTQTEVDEALVEALGNAPTGTHTLYYQVARSDTAEEIFSKDYRFDNIPLTAAHLTLSFDATTPAFSSAETKNITLKASKADVGIASVSYEVKNAVGSVVLTGETLTPAQNETTGKTELPETGKTLTMPANASNGIYTVTLSATDANGNTGSVSADFLWRRTAAAAGELKASKTYQTLPGGANAGALLVGPEDTLDLSLEITETFLASAEDLTSNPLTAYYSVSTDNGETWGGWVKSDAAFTAQAETAYKATLSIKIDLSKGIHNVKVRAAVLNGSETAPSNGLVDIADKMIYAYHVEDLSDYTDGGITWTYNPAKTKGKIEATLTVTDDPAYQITEVKVYKVTNPGTENEAQVEVSTTSVSGLNTAEYSCKVTFDESAVYRAVAKNDCGFTWSQEVTISAIGAAAACTDIVYSTTDPTAAAVRVKLTFDQPNVSIEKIEMENENDELVLVPDSIAVIQGQDTVYIKKNCQIKVTFRDSYGYTGEKFLSVQNIINEPPRLVPELTVAGDNLTASMILRLPNLGLDNYADPFNRQLQDYKVFYNGREYDVATNTAAEGTAPVYTPTVFTFQSNGEYELKIYDAVHNTQTIKLTVTGIDREAAKIEKVTVSYNTHGGTEKEISHSPGAEAGYAFTNDTYDVTNQDVEVVLTTDKKVTLLGAAVESYNTETTKTYYENGIFNFALQAENKTVVSYAVGIELIDKTPPTIEFSGSQELVFVEGMTSSQDTSLAYDKNKLLDYHAYDTYRGVTTELTGSVVVDYGAFDPDNIDANTFDRSQPYTVTYKVTDAAGNTTEVRRTIRLVGQYDTILLIDGKMPSSDGTAQSTGEFTLNLKNFAGTAYVRYARGYYTMGQMKTTGVVLPARNGAYTLSGLETGWYTVYVQTDKRDYFVQWVWVNGAN